MEQFEHLEGWDLLVESRQYRSGGIGSMNLRNISDFAFLDLIALYILSNEYETAPVSAAYANRTMLYKNFDTARLNGTDLYVSLNILNDADSVFSKKIQKNAEADSILRSKIDIKLPVLKRYFDLLSDSKMTQPDAEMLLLRLEKLLDITDSKLRSIRRLAQDWPSLSNTQRSLVLDRMLQYYRRFAKRSEIAVFLDDLSKSKGYEISAPLNAEMKKLGQKSPIISAAAAILGPALGLRGGYEMGYRLFGPKRDK